MGMGDRRMKRYTIGLITGILLTASALPLIAQEDASGLTLEKDGNQVWIPLGGLPTDIANESTGRDCIKT